MLWWTYRNTKARTELGFQPRPHEETLEDAVRWQSDVLGDALAATAGRPELCSARSRGPCGGEKVSGR